MKHHNATSRILGAVLAASAWFGVQAYAQEPGCRTGATALADAYVLANPMYSYFLGELEPYVAGNSEHFAANGDAIRCAAALSRAFLGSTIQLYDPSDRERQDEANARLGAMGIAPGQQEATPSSQLLSASMELSRLARVLPAVAVGDYGPLRTPTNEIEQMRQLAGQVFQMLLAGDPEMAAMIQPLIRELASIEHRALLRAAERLANAP